MQAIDIDLKKLLLQWERNHLVLGLGKNLRKREQSLSGLIDELEDH